jgi:hypothetical protein
MSRSMAVVERMSERAGTRRLRLRSMPNPSLDLVIGLCVAQPGAQFDIPGRSALHSAGQPPAVLD